MAALSHRSEELDWDRVADLARECAWTTAVADAMTVLRSRGWDVPAVDLGRPAVADRLFKSRARTGTGTRADRLLVRSALAARIVRHRGSLRPYLPFNRT